MYLHPDLAIYATDRFVLACIALFLEAVIGRMSWLFRIIPHPFAILRSSAAFLGRRLSRSRRGPRALIVRGAIVTGFLCCATGSVGWMISSWGETYPAGWVVDLMFLVFFVSQRGSYSDASRTVRAQSKNGLVAGRKALACYHKGRIDALDEHGIYRSLTEHLAAEMGRWLIGPLFWYLVGGLPALLVYATIVAAVDALAADDESRAGFGWTASRLEFMAGWLPGRIAGVFVVLASLLAPTARPIRSARVMVQMARSSPSPAHGWPAAAMAGALSLEIAGPNSTEGRELPWIGEGSARATVRDAHRALLLFGYVCVMNIVFILGGAIGRILWL